MQSRKISFSYRRVLFLYSFLIFLNFAVICFISLGNLALSRCSIMCVCFLVGVSDSAGPFAQVVMLWPLWLFLVSGFLDYWESITCRSFFWPLAASLIRISFTLCWCVCVFSSWCLDSAGPFAQVVTAFWSLWVCCVVQVFRLEQSLSLTTLSFWPLSVPLIWCIRSFSDFTLVSKLTLPLMVVGSLVVIVWDYHQML